MLGRRRNEQCSPPEVRVIVKHKSKRQERMRHNNDGLSSVAIIITLVLAASAATAGWLWYQAGQDDDEAAQIASFDDCVEAGYEVEDDDVRECRTPDGEVFSEELTEAEVAEELEEEPQRQEYESDGGVMIYLDSPQDFENVTSPVTVSGEVPGNWSFEGDFPIELHDQSGEAILTVPGTLQGDWMTESHVPFEVEIEFSGVEPGAEGALVFIKDNPSDKPELDDRLEIPIRFGE